MRPKDEPQTRNPIPRSFVAVRVGALPPPHPRLECAPMKTATRVWHCFSAAVLMIAAVAHPAAGQGMIAPQETKPYDERLMRLSEILGAVHYLRELCGAND